MEAINESTKLLANAVERLKAELEPAKPSTVDNLLEIISMLEQAIERLLTK